MLHKGSTLNYFFKYILLQPLGLLAFSQISCFNSETFVTKSKLEITEKCSPGFPGYFHTGTTIPESHVTTSPNCMTIIIFRLLYLCDGLLYQIALIAHFLLRCTGLFIQI